MPSNRNYFESMTDDDSMEEILNEKLSTPPRGGILQTFSKRNFSLRKKKKQEVPAAVTPSPPPKALQQAVEMKEDEDPVMAHFRSRTTQRVRFDFDAPSPAKPTHKPHKPSAQNKNPSAIQRFMKGALFTRKREEESNIYQREAAKELKENSIKWHDSTWRKSSGPAKVPASPDRSNNSSNSSFDDGGGDDLPPLPETLTFSAEERPTLAKVTKLLNKARRAIHVHYRYGYAVKCYVKALDMLKGFPDDHPTVVKTMEGLNQAHQLQSSFQNSANIVKMGIKSEDTGELVRALKMYTIAYRIRRDHLGRGHPSLIVLLNMLGSIQIKRGELEEAMQIYELALTDLKPAELNAEEESPAPGSMRSLTKSMTYREMGSIYEAWGDQDKALEMYHQSLQCIAEFKGLDCHLPNENEAVAMTETLTEIPPEPSEGLDETEKEAAREQQAILEDLELVHMTRSYVKQTEVVNTDKGGDGMELVFGLQKKGKKNKKILQVSHYDVFFPPGLEDKISRKGFRRGSTSKHMETDFSDVDAALTLHLIAQLHRAKGEYNIAIAAFK